MSWLYADLSKSEDMALVSHDAPLISVFFRVKVIVNLIIELFLQ